MNVYVESNFVLELALRQAQSESCFTLVNASVVSHLAKSGGAGQHCFLNRDKDFEDQNVVDELSNWGCKLLTNFDHGLDFVRSQVTPASAEENA